MECYTNCTLQKISDKDKDFYFQGEANGKWPIFQLRYATGYIKQIILQLLKENNICWHAMAPCYTCNRILDCLAI